MKTARFTTVVQRCGKPEVHLAFTTPAKDRTLQKAIKASRVMTVEQENVGSKTDRGKVGFQSGKGRQYLIFPKSLRAFDEMNIVGIKYDLLAPRVVAARDRAPRHKPKAKKTAGASRTAHSEKPTPVPSESAPTREAHSRVGKKGEASVNEIKRQIRRAMKHLEAGKTVAAFNLLKGVVDE